ncbi:hypothetical protein [Herbaspirillum rhizosphaerae]|uniref:hypothetical protein n=1 Tax=Herbaspirillum rhizosphaerae TaxID=346179 RepID=UPI00067C7D53|nr:hypothetical protein [Herbaspirillum rhizosphaerae]
MTKPVRIAASLLLVLTSALAFSAENIASDRDIGKAMNLLPPDVQKNLDDNAARDAKGASANTPELSPRCRQLRADIERAQHGAPEPQHNTYPQERRRDGGFVPAPSSIPGVQVNSSNSAPGQIRYSRRARLEDQFQRECR